LYLKKSPTCSNASMRRLQGIRLLFQSYQQAFMLGTSQFGVQTLEGYSRE